MNTSAHPFSTIVYCDYLSLDIENKISDQCSVQAIKSSSYRYLIHMCKREADQNTVFWNQTPVGQQLKTN